MAKKSSGRGSSRLSATTSGYFSGMSPIAMNQIDEGASLPTRSAATSAAAPATPMAPAPQTTPITESNPGQVSGGGRMNPAGPVTELAPVPGEAGVRAAPPEASLRDFADKTGQAANAVRGAATLGAIAGDRTLAGMMPAGSALGKISNIAGLANNLQEGNWGKATVGAVGMINPVAGFVGDVGMRAYDAATRGTVNDGPMNGVIGRGVSVFGGPVSQLNDDGSQNVFVDGTKYTEAYTPGFQTPTIDSTTGTLSQGAAPAAPSQAEADAAFDRDWSAGMNEYSGGGGGESRDSATGHGGGDDAADGGLATANGFARAYAEGGIVGLTGPTYADGGAVTEAPRSLAQMGFANGGGVGMQAPGSPMPQQDPMAMANRMSRDPAMQQKIQQFVGPAMQSGQLTPEELVTLGRIAEASLHNPQLYPQLRKFAESNGMTPLPPAYDQRIATMLIVAAKVMGGGGQQATPPGQVPPTDQAQMQNPTGAPNGGMLQGPGTGRSDSIGTVNESTGAPVKVANGEYVIPKHVVDAKGKEFFDKMLRQYAQLTPQGA